MQTSTPNMGEIKVTNSTSVNQISIGVSLSVLLMIIAIISSIAVVMTAIVWRRSKIGKHSSMTKLKISKAVKVGNGSSIILFCYSNG